MIDKSHRPTFQPTFFSVYGVVGLLLSAFIHVGSFGRMIVPSDSGVFLLMHAGIFPLFFVFVTRAREWQVSTSGKVNGWSFDFRHSLPSAELLAHFPWWAIVFVLGLFIYAMINFFLATGVEFGRVSSGGLTDVQSARLFSGHWMLFYAMPAVFFGFVPAGGRSTMPTRNPSGDES
jgi:hypothetical protein